MILTGANAGIGFETARGLSALGARVGLVCRDTARGEETRRRLLEHTKAADLAVFAADLSSQRQVRGLAAEIRARFTRVDVLVNNAAVVYSRRTLSEDGIEMQFAVNYLAPFLLTHLLLDRLKAAGSARVVNVTSRAHARGRIDFEDLNAEGGYFGPTAYNQSKLALVLFTYELARRLAGTGVTVNCVHPGLVRTAIGYRHSTRFHGLLHWLLCRVAATPAAGARPVIHLALAEELSGRTGGYYAWTRPARSSPASRSENLARRLWQASEALTGLAAPE